MPKQCELEHIAKGICSANKLQYIRFIDAGAFKETYQVQDQEKTYALKVFKANNSNERTEREIDAMRRASCANVAQLFKVDSFVGSDGNFLYLQGKWGKQDKTRAFGEADYV